MFPNLRLLFLRFFIVVQEINYPSCFIVKQKKVWHLVIPSITQQTQPFPSLRSRVFVLSRYFREQRQKIRWHDRRKFAPSGWEWMVYGFCHKSLKTRFDWPETLSLSCELLKVGCDWLFRPQTTVETTDNRI